MPNVEATASDLWEVADYLDRKEKDAAQRGRAALVLRELSKNKNAIAESEAARDTIRGQLDDARADLATVREQAAIIHANAEADAASILAKAREDAEALAEQMATASKDQLAHTLTALANAKSELAATTQKLAAASAALSA